MSLLLRETLHVFLAPTTVQALSRSARRRRLGHARSYPVATKSGEAWQEALVVFSAILRDFHCRRVRVVLSHHFVQYRLLSWREDLVGDTEYLALAQLEFSATFGTMADAWAIGLSDEPPGVPRVASALSSALLAGLGVAAGEAGVKLVAMQPYLAVVADLWGRNVSGSVCSWLLVHEPGRICVVARQGGSWCWVRHLRVGEDWPQQLLDILQNESQLAGREAIPTNVHVFAPSASRDAHLALRDAGFQVIEASSLSGFAVGLDGAFAPAWLG